MADPHTHEKQASHIEIQPVAPATMAVADREIPAPIAGLTEGGLLVQRAMDTGVPVESLRELLAMKREMDADEAARAFARAKAQFDKDCPPVIARTENQQFQVMRDGRTRNRRYASREDIEKTIRAPAAANGFSYSWGDTYTDKEDGTLTVVCIVLHVGGHERKAAVTLPTEVKTNKPSAQQVVASVIEFGRRLTLINAFGLAMSDDDADGAVPSEPIAPDQVAVLKAAIKETDASLNGFLSYFRIDALKDLPVDRLDEATRILAEKKRQQEAQP
jgi:hypothetical protein